MVRFNQCRGEGVFRPLAGDDFVIPPEHKLQGIATWRIHAGRQWFFFIHNLSFYLMDMDVLSARSDRGWQTCRSESVRAVQGMIPLTAVRPAPLCRFLRPRAARACHTVLHREARHV